MKKFAALLILLLIFALPALADAPEIEFNRASGFYDDLLMIRVACNDKKAKIYYTLDGSVPDENALLYEGDILLFASNEREDVLTQITGISAEGNYVPEEDFPTAHVVRAVAVNQKGERSAVISATYFVGVDREENYGDLPIMCLVTDPDNLFDHEKGIYVLGKVFEEWAAQQTESFKPRDVEANFTQRGSEWEREVSVAFLPKAGTGFTQEMGIRVKGDGSRTVYQKSLRLIAREKYGGKNVKYPIFPDNVRQETGGVVEKYKAFTLRNGGNDWGHSYLRDHFITRLAVGLNLETAQTMPVIAFINGEYWGLYTLTEEFTDNFFQYHYGMDDKNVIIVKKGELEEGEEKDMALYEDLFTHIAKKDMTNPANYKKAGELLDLQSYAELCALHLYICNNDGIFQYNNWEMWRVRQTDRNFLKADGKWRMILYDMDITSGAFGDGTRADYDNISPVLADTYSGRDPARLFGALIKNEEFREMFIMACCDLRNQYFSAGRVSAMAETLYAPYIAQVPANVLRHGPEYMHWSPEKHYEQSLEKLDNFFAQRYELFMPMLQKAFGEAALCRVTFDLPEDMQGQIFVNGRNIPVAAGDSHLYFPGDEITLRAVPDKGARFGGWTIAGEERRDAAITLTIAGDVTLTANFK